MYEKTIVPFVIIVIQVLNKLRLEYYLLNCELIFIATRGK